MASIRLVNVSKSFGKVEAVKALNLEIEDKEFFCLLGPPGAGKTTTLRTILGLERPDQGEIYVGDRLVNDVHPGSRDMAMIFQNLALYPDKTVFDNIAFPLRIAKMPQTEVRRRVMETAGKLHIEHLLDKLPGKCSGGERQRIAIGRAIVRSPMAYLMDEPLSNLDALLRLEMRTELKRLQTELGQTLVYATHDQAEAMTMGDRIAVMRLGEVQQCDVPEVIYNEPRNKYVARVVGSPPMNFVDCVYEVSNGRALLDHGSFRIDITAVKDRVRGGQVNQQVSAGIRPEDVVVSHNREGLSEEAFRGMVFAVEPLGSETILDIEIGKDAFKAVVSPDFQVGYRDTLWVDFRVPNLHLFDARTELALYNP